MSSQIGDLLGKCACKKMFSLTMATKMVAAWSPVSLTWIVLLNQVLCISSFTDTTHARLIQELSGHTLPLMWDDVSNINQLESIALMCYNKVQLFKMYLESYC